MNRQSWRRLAIATNFALVAFTVMWAIEPPDPFGYTPVGWVMIGMLTAFVFFGLLRLQEVERQLEQQQIDKPKEIQFSHVKLRDGNKW